MQARFSIILAVTMLVAGTAAMDTANAVDLPKRDALRVCADPNLLPFSNDKLEGYENKIAAMIGEALSNRQIAERLVLSERTVETHVRNILGKLGYSTRTEIATWSVRNG